MFWSFRIMVGLGVLLLFTFAASLWAVHRKNLPQKRWLLKLAMYSLPLPWIANELGWFVAEYGRQPWTITNILPTHLSASSIDVAPVAMSLIGFVVIYTLLLIVELYLMIKYVKWGPASLRTGRYFGEKSA
jgi:Cytochrome bd-type quinol oxidase, subunit 1